MAQPAGARPLALGGAYVALADDAWAGMWNPSGLALVRQPEAGATYQREPGGVDYGYLLLASPVAVGHGVGVTVGTLRTGAIEYVDAVGTPLSSPGESDLMAGAAWGASLIPLFSPASPDAFGLLAGLSVRYLQMSLGGVIGGAAVADAGGLVLVPVAAGQPSLRVGAAWKNIGSRIRLGHGGAAIASPVDVGAAQTILESAATWTTISLETGRLTSRREFGWHAGIEQAWKPELRPGFALRVGYRGGDGLPGPSFGLGVRWDQFVFDYGAAVVGELGVVHRVGLRIQWGSE